MNAETALIKSFLYLTACALHSTVPERHELENTDWEELLSLAAAQKMTVMIAVAVDLIPDETKKEIGIPQEILQKLESARLSNLRRCLLFDQERKRITEWLDSQNIWYIPLKGIILQEYYPVYEMREMADNDILFDSSKRICLK